VTLPGGKNLREIIPHLLLGGSSAGVAGVIAYKLVESNPALIIEMFKSWGPLSLLSVLGLMVMDRGFRRMVDASEKSSAAQQRLADAVHQIAHRDDYEKEQQKILLGHIGTTMEKVLARLESIEENSKARGANA
jgi:hypothetical protein